MVRTPLTPEERERGERLGQLLRQARGDRTMVDVAGPRGLSPETLRKIETGRAPTPAFFTVAAAGGRHSACRWTTSRPAAPRPV